MDSNLSSSSPGANPLSSGGGNETSTSSRSKRLTDRLIRERNADVFNYYQDVRSLGEGSIGSVRLVKRRRGTEGGSAYREVKVGICGCLANGIFGCSWLARSTETDMRRSRTSINSKHSEMYALKSIQLRLVQNEYLDELRNEISVLRSLDHPNIVKAYEVYETKRNIYVLMEYCSGGDLYTRAPYVESQAANIIHQLCSAIGHMHANGIIHRDIKCENIMWESPHPRAKIKLLDFGLSKKYMQGMYLSDWCGTLYTMSPQVIDGAYTNKADCWSIGVIAFLLLCNEKPFRGKRSQVLRQIKDCDYNFKDVGWFNVSKEAKQFVAALLTKYPNKRLSADEALQHSWLKKKLFETKSEKNLMENVTENMLTYAKTSELKKIAAIIVAHKSSVKEISKMRRAFEQFDIEKNGVISMDEFKAALGDFDEYSEEDIHDMFGHIDVNKNGKIIYTEFIAATLELHGRVEEKRLADAFDHIDDDDSGYISKENLQKLLGGTPERIKSLIESADTDGDGKISFDEFLVMFRKENIAAVGEEDA